MYALFTAIGIALAFVVMRLTRHDAAVGEHQPTVRLAAVVGAILGAYLFQLPADVFGWSAVPVGLAPLPLPPAMQDSWLAWMQHLPLGGRTVLGGLLGGWIAVEITKRVIGLRAPTGDGFAPALAIALAAGRMGCVAAGCCPGAVCRDDAWWAAHDAVGVARYPAPLIESGFHLAAFALLMLADRRGWWPGRRLAAYLAIYAVVRFGIESIRDNPPVLVGLSWYQWLCVALFAIAGGTWWARRGRPAPMPGAGPMPTPTDSPVA